LKYDAFMGESENSALDLVSFADEDPGSELAAHLLSRYYDELDTRFPGGFDVERSASAPIEDMRPPCGAFLVARVEGHPIGCGAVRKLDDTTAEIKRMWIDPVVRGQGIGRQLLSALETAAHELGFLHVRLDTNAQLPEAIALYRSSGYTAILAYSDNQYADFWFEKRDLGFDST
jgi:GNAT superfamily N-acetyltransferase